ncbi:MAG TPA: hypothetical protein VFC00_38895 [Micromonosporaceae bacterium]|nr:hypothetical protein [Micromonosporaceae bacterium]
MHTPESIEAEHTLLTAAARYDALRMQDALAPPPLAKEETLEMLALGEVLARKASYGRQLGVRSARAAGASWSQIGAALGTSKQSAWESHLRWIEDQDASHRRAGFEGMSDDEVAAARKLAGEPDDGLEG